MAVQIKECQREQRKEGVWCVELEAFTNATHCLICERKGKEYTKEHFDLRDGKKQKPVAPKRSRGLGDTVAKAIHKVSRGKIKPCEGCKKRQAKLNRLIPYKEAI